VRLGRFGRGDHFFVAGLRTPVADVVADGAAEQHHSCSARRSGGAALLVQLAHIHAVDQHAPAADIVEARDQVHQAGFARPGGAQQGHHLARLGGEADAFQHRHRCRCRCSGS
jgi:hypothetical protein